MEDSELVVVWFIVVVGWMGAVLYLLTEILRVGKSIEASAAAVAYGDEAADVVRTRRREVVDPAAGIRAQEEAARRRDSD